MIDKRMLAEYAAALGLPLGEAELERFDRYAELLVEWNERMNLTAITEPGGDRRQAFCGQPDPAQGVYTPRGGDPGRRGDPARAFRRCR